MSIKQQRIQYATCGSTASINGAATVAIETCLNLLPRRHIDDGLTLAIMQFTLVSDLSGKGSVSQKVIERAGGERLTSCFPSMAIRPSLADATEQQKTATQLWH